MSAGTKMGIEKVARALVYLVYFWVMLSIAILVTGFFLLLFGANPDASFAEWVYRALDRVMKPFRGIFESVDLSGNSVLDVSVLFAMIVYGMLALALRALIDWLTYRIVLVQQREAALASSMQAPTVAAMPPVSPPHQPTPPQG
jgi:uncharacterized protein YggT (Ycf19 family)